MKQDVISLNTFGQFEALAESHDYPDKVYDFYKKKFIEKLSESWDNFKVKFISNPDMIWPVEYDGDAIDAFDQIILYAAVESAWHSTLAEFSEK